MKQRTLQLIAQLLELESKIPLPIDERANYGIACDHMIKVPLEGMALWRQLVLSVKNKKNKTIRKKYFKDIT